MRIKWDMPNSLLNLFNKESEAKQETKTEEILVNINNLVNEFLNIDNLSTLYTPEENKIIKDNLKKANDSFNRFINRKPEKQWSTYKRTDMINQEKNIEKLFEELNEIYKTDLLSMEDYNYRNLIEWKNWNLYIGSIMPILEKSVNLNKEETERAYRIKSDIESKYLGLDENSKYIDIEYIYTNITQKIAWIKDFKQDKANNRVEIITQNEFDISNKNFSLNDIIKSYSRQIIKFPKYKYDIMNHYKEILDTFLDTEKYNNLRNLLKK